MIIGWLGILVLGRSCSYYNIEKVFEKMKNEVMATATGYRSYLCLCKDKGMWYMI